VRAVAAIVLVVICAWWLLANPVPSGGIVLTVTERHGVDVADLAVLPLLALAAWLIWPRRRPARDPVAAEPTPALMLAPPVEVLILCSANQCRSPMAAELLYRSLHTLGVPAVVRSAGTSAESGLPALDEARAAVGGLDDHRTVALAEPLVEHADLVVGMTRHHVREAILLCPAVLPRTFTVLELVRRGRAVGPRPAGESVEHWLIRAGAGRRLADLAGTSEVEEMPDPIGHGPEAVAKSAADLGAALDEIVELMWGAAQRDRAYEEVVRSR
jgi:protein-tyrosine-phosphatase